jgi:hypothetical protein
VDPAASSMGSGKADELTVHGLLGKPRRSAQLIERSRRRLGADGPKGYLTLERVRSEVLASPSRTAGRGQHRGSAWRDCIRGEAVSEPPLTTIPPRERPSCNAGEPRGTASLATTLAGPPEARRPWSATACSTAPSASPASAPISSAGAARATPRAPGRYASVARAGAAEFLAGHTALKLRLVTPGSKSRLARGGSCIAGAGFEPATFGL